MQFTVPANTAFQLDTISGPDVSEPAFAHPPEGTNSTDAPREEVGVVFLGGEPAPVLNLRWVECVGVYSCGDARKCDPLTDTCVDCADGDELFDMRAASAPRTNAEPRSLEQMTAEGVVCSSDDDWYILEQAAGQPLSLAGAELNMVRA